MEACQRDGTFIVFRTNSDLGMGFNNKHQVYRFQRNQGGAGQLILVSKDTGGNLASQDCLNPAVSDDGLVVVFETTAALDPSRDSGSSLDIYVRQNPGSTSGTTTLLSRSLSGVHANGSSCFPSISGDGKVVAFTSSATDLTTDPVVGLDNVYRVGTTPGGPGNVPMELISISDDNPPLIANAPMRTTDPTLITVGSVLNFTGRLIVFEGAPRNWVGMDGNLNSGGIEQIYCRDVTGPQKRTHLISRSLANPAVHGDGASRRPSISSLENPQVGGERIVWSSVARNLEIPPATDFTEDVFISLLPPTTVSPFKVSVGLNGQLADGASFNPMVDSIGTKVVFQSAATNLVSGDTNLFNDIFVRDGMNVPGFVIRRFNVNPTTVPPTQANASSSNAAITGDGRVVAYQSSATNLIASDTNNRVDIFETLSPEGPFHRGDVNLDGFINQTDGIFINNWLFQNGPRPVCLDAADANDSSIIDISDSVYIFNFAYQGGPPPPCPHPCCGADPTFDPLTCAKVISNCQACQ